MSDPYDFIQRMPLDELSRFVRDLCYRFGMTDEDLARLRGVTPAEFQQMLDALEQSLRRRLAGPDSSGCSGGREA